MVYFNLNCIKIITYVTDDAIKVYKSDRFTEKKPKAVKWMALWLTWDENCCKCIKKSDLIGWRSCSFCKLFCKNFRLFSYHM